MYFLKKPIINDTAVKLTLTLLVQTHYALYISMHTLAKNNTKKLICQFIKEKYSHV